MRYQYRVRWYPSYVFSDEHWSLNGFVSTGDNFSGSHNTIDADISQHFYVRRAFVRYQRAEFVSEAGIIPTFKGRVSSSGLSKNGFIQGARIVTSSLPNAKLEIVVGELTSTDAADAFRLPETLNYLEMEYSATLTDTSGYEVSLERMTGASFVRAEYRSQVKGDTDLFVEWVKRLDNLDDKIVLGGDGVFSVFAQQVDWHGYYTYVSDGMGARAELTEDFISTGHGVSLEMDTELMASRTWRLFARFDGFRDNTRFMLGIKAKL